MRFTNYTLYDESVTVDGVTYGVDAVRRLVQERHRLAGEVTDLRAANAHYRARLRRADRHLRLRTSALVRMIAKKGPRL